jgi:hypothetical protein
MQVLVFPNRAGFSTGYPHFDRADVINRQLHFFSVAQVVVAV